MDQGPCSNARQRVEGLQILKEDKWLRINTFTKQSKLYVLQLHTQVGIWRTNCIKPKSQYWRRIPGPDSEDDNSSKEPSCKLLRWEKWHAREMIKDGEREREKERASINALLRATVTRQGWRVTVVAQKLSSYVLRLLGEGIWGLG